MMRNLLFAGNDKVFDGILSCLVSILRRTTSQEPLRVFIMTMDASHLRPDYLPITEAQVDFLARYLRGFNAESDVIRLDVTELYRQEFAGSPNEGAYCSPYTLLRLLADLVPALASLDRLLYLDCDLLFNRDIDLLYGQPLEGYEYAAAGDHYGKYLIRPSYINAGVLLFSMQEARRTDLFGKARAWIRRKKLVFADQSALIRSTTRKRLLPQKFNDQKFLHGSTVVRHFSKRLFWFPYPHTDNIKQWQVDRVRRVFRYRAFDDILDEYLALKDTFMKEQETQTV